MSLTEEQQKIADEMCEDLKPITFIQGKAGTGKSYLIKELVDIIYNALTEEDITHGYNIAGTGTIDYDYQSKSR